jgi:hypothetical protein
LAATARIGLRGVVLAAELVPRQQSYDDATVNRSLGRASHGPSGGASGDAS